MMNPILEEEYISQISEYIDTMPQPESKWPKYYFESQAYALWAAQEVYTYVLYHANLTPMYAIREISDIFYDYSTSDFDNKNIAWIFRIAYDTAVDIYDYLIETIGEE